MASDRAGAMRRSDRGAEPSGVGQAADLAGPSGWVASTVEPDPRRWRALSVCLIAGFMSLLDVSIVNVALPSIRAGLHASTSDLQWVVSGYALAFGLVLVPAGRLGDARGRRTMFLIGLALFTASSAAVGLSPSPGWIAVLRLVQGAAGGLLNPQVAGLIQQLFRGAERGRAFGMLGATIGLSTAVGPLAGGIILGAFGEEHGWRWVFFVNVPVGLAALPLAYRLLPAPQPRERREGLDPVGVLLLGTGVLLLLLPLVEERQWQGTAKWWLMPAAVVVLAGFVGWERWYARRGDPLLPLELFRVRSYSLGATLALLYFCGFAAIFFVLALFLQIGEGYSPLLAGLAITPFALGSAVASALGGRAVTQLGRPLVVVGLAMVVAGLLGTEWAIGAESGRAVGWTTLAPLLVAGLGSGLVIAPNQAITLSHVPVARSGTAAGLLQTGQRLGSAIGIAAVGAVFFSRVAATGDYAHAIRQSMWVSVAFAAASLLLGIGDVVVGRRTGRG
jgi:EmrB/QacA subfamily drug resistance transporter